MKRVKSWFVGLSNAGKASVIAAIVSGGFITAAATSIPASPPPSPPSINESVKEPVTTTKEEVKEEPIPFEKESINDNSLAKGTTTIKTAGVAGVKTITYVITLKDGKEINRVASEAITTAPINEVVAIGTYVAPPPQQNCDSNYSGCVPNVSYDLDCPDISYSVEVYGDDPHGFDRDGDGYGCESY